jgi:hypothetical protein
MKNRTLAFLTILFFLAAGVAAASPSSAPAVEASLALPFDTVLPGVPFDMTVTLKNVSTSNASVGLGARFFVDLPNGEKFSARFALALEPRSMDSHPDNWVDLAPGESRVYFVPWDDAATMWGHGGEYTAPGIYGLRLQLESESHPDDYVGPLTTTTANLTRVVPPGDDEILWKRMSKAFDGHWADDGLYNSIKGPAILNEILNSHPTSAYYPYALLFVNQSLPKPARAREEDIAKNLAAAAAFSDSPAYPHLLLVPGEIAYSLASSALADRREDAGLEYLRRAEQFFERAVKTNRVMATQSVGLDQLQRVRNQMDAERNERGARIR